MYLGQDALFIHIEGANEMRTKVDIYFRQIDDVRGIIVRRMRVRHISFVFQRESSTSHCLLDFQIWSM